jgi:hypothetical protein
MGGGNVDKFVQRALPAATRVAQKLDVPVEAVIGQWGLEVGWGKSVIPGTNNLGNIMDFSGKGVEAVDNKLKRKDKYRQYESVDAFADDFANLLSNQRYKSVPGTKDPLAYFQKLSDSGYAEAKDYASTGVKATNMVAKSLQRTGAATTASRETSAPAARKELPPSLPPMAGAPAAPGKMAADLGPGYQAALALSFLSDTDEREDRDVEKEPGIAEQWLAQTESRPSALAEVAEISIKSPFAAPKQAQAFRDGGEAKGDSRSWLEKFYQADKDMARMPRLPTSPLGVAVNAGYEAYKYVTESDPLNDLKKELKKRSGREVDTGSEPMDQEEKKSFPVPRADGGEVAHLAGGGLPYTPTAMVSPGKKQQLASIKSQYDAYNAQIDAYNAAANAYNAGPRTADFTTPMPTAPGTTPEQYEALGAAAKKDVNNRNLALQVMADPSRYGLSINSFFADGGEVQERLTPQQIEQLSAREALEREKASSPAFLTPKSGKGRQISTKTGELEAAALQGVSEMPYLLAGAPVDLATMAMRPFGYDVEKPMGGSEDLKQRALDAGIRKAPPEGKAARALYELTQAGASAVNPAAPVRGAVKAAEKTGEAAKMLAEDFIQYNRQLSVPGASYAVRNKGTPVVIDPKRPVTTDDFHSSMSQAELRAFKERNPDVALYSEREMAATPEFQAFAAKANAPVDAAESFVRKDVATTPDPTLNNWFTKTLTRYLRSDFASPQDQLVRAAEEGKMLHLAPKKFSDYSDVDAETAKLLKAKAQDNKNARRTEGFLPEGETNTDYGQRIESLTDIAAYPEQIGDLSPNRVPPSMRGLLETDPEARVMDFAPDIGGILKLPQLRDKMLEIRSLGPKAEYSAYGQAPAKVPDEFLLPDDTLAKLNVAAASNRVARFTRWQDETRQAMATTALRSDPGFNRRPLQEGKYIGVALPDVDVYPKYMKLVNDVGCDGGWCTQAEGLALTYGSGDARLHVIVSGEGKKARPVAQISVEKGKGKDGSTRYGITEIKERGDTDDFLNNPALPAIQEYVQSLDSTYDGLQFVSDLKKLGMKQLPKNPMGLLDLFDGFRARSQLAKAFGSEQEGFKLVRDELIKLNNGSQYTTGNEDDVAGLIDQAVQNVLNPRQRANGGMVERQSTDSRKYL